MSFLSKCLLATLASTALLAAEGPSLQETLAYVKQHGASAICYRSDQPGQAGRTKSVEIVNEILKVEFTTSFESSTLTLKGTKTYLVKLKELIPSKCSLHPDFMKLESSPSTKAIQYFWDKTGTNKKTGAFVDHSEAQPEHSIYLDTCGEMGERVFKAILHAAKLIGAKEESDPFK